MVRITSALPPASTFFMFKRGIKPEWEDKSNAQGGRFTLKFRSDDPTGVNDAWLNTMLAMIGASLGEQANGCVISFKPRSGFQLRLWTSTCDKTSMEALGKAWKAFLGTSERAKFEPHEKSPTKQAFVV
jgi:translation initiation factor 4E